MLRNPLASALLQPLALECALLFLVRVSHELTLVSNRRAGEVNRTPSRLLGRQRPHLEDTRKHFEPLSGFDPLRASYKDAPFARTERGVEPATRIALASTSVPGRSLPRRTGKVSYSGSRVRPDSHFRDWWRCRELNPQSLLAKQTSDPSHTPAGPEGIEPSSAALETALRPTLGPIGRDLSPCPLSNLVRHTDGDQDGILRTHLSARRTGIGPVSDDRQSSCDTSRITTHSVSPSRVERDWQP